LKADGANACEVLYPGVEPCWTVQGDFLENVVGTPFRDTLFSNTLNNKITGGDGGTLSFPEAMDGREGSDTYTGYAPGGTVGGVDLIQDIPELTNIDKLNLAKVNLADVSIAPYAGTFGSDNLDTLHITLPDGEEIYRWTYFNGTSTDACANASGTGLIEKIIFADDPNVDFAQVKDLLGCSAAGSVQALASDAATGTTQEGQKLQSQSFPESSNGVTTDLQR
jgi:hypothetical protein